MVNTMNRWDDPKYQRIVSAKLDNTNAMVSFEDNTTVLVNIDQFLPQEFFYNLAGLELNTNPYELVFSSPVGEKTIPWTTVRLIDDSDFAAHKAQLAEAEARDVGLRIKALRNSKGLSSKELSKRAGISPQSLSRIERGHHDVVYTTLTKILAAMGYTLADLVKVDVTPLTLSDLSSRLESIGLKKDWLLNRILPNDVTQALLDSTQEGSSELIKQAANCVSKVFQWPIDNILDPSQMIGPSPQIVSNVKFKARRGVNQQEALIYATYTQFLAKLVVDATPEIGPSQISSTPKEIRRNIADKFGIITLENVLNYAWDSGIRVIPLSDSGVFHGACWNIEDHIVIVLKQNTSYQARWLYDLAHEIGHVPHIENSPGLIEFVEISPFNNDSDEEKSANQFASELLLAGRAEELTQMCVKKANGNLRFLKSAVNTIAAQQQVPADILANYIAYRLSSQNENWWGTASKFQISEPSPMNLTRKILLDKINWQVISDFERGILERALTNSAE